MKLQPSNHLEVPINLSQAKPRSELVSSTEASSPSSKPELELSEHTHILHSIEQVIHSSPEFDAARVQQMQQKLANGELGILSPDPTHRLKSAQQLAAAISSLEMGLGE